MRLETLTWAEAENELKRAPLILVPIGAACKEHGLHLPLNTDFILAEYLCGEVSKRLEVLSLPSIAYGYYPAFVEYPGSINISKQTFSGTICDIARSLRRHSPAKIYFLNTGISTNFALEPARIELAAEGILIEYTDLNSIISELESSVKQQERGSHADEIETSMLLHIAPQMVKMELAKREDNLPRGSARLTRDPNSQSGIFSETGVWGDPTLASAAKGQLILEGLIDSIVKFLEEFKEDTFLPSPARQHYISS